MAPVGGEPDPRGGWQEWPRAESPPLFPACSLRVWLRGSEDHPQGWQLRPRGPLGRHGLVWAPPRPAMVVTRLALELRFQGGRLRGVRCELARWPRGAPPETAASTVGQVLVPVLLSGLGMVVAGLLMDRVQVRTGVWGGRAWRGGARSQTMQDRPQGQAGSGLGGGQACLLGKRAPELQSS